MRVGLIGDPGPARTARIAETFPDVDFSGPADVERDEILTALLLWSLDVDSAVTLLARYPTISWVHLANAGVPRELLGALYGRDVTLTNGSGAHAPALAEFVVAALLAFTKRLPDLRRAQEAARWDGAIRVRELRGQTVGIIGLGDIGRATARLLRALGVRVVGVRRNPVPVPELDKLYPREQLDDFLSKLDALVLAAPLTRETELMIGTHELARLPRGACVVNVARGALIDEQALVAALQSGHLGGAALDVFTDEPLPSDSPLWRLPNTILSPHCADRTPGTLDRALDIFLDNLKRYRAAGELLNVVDRDLGY